MNHVDPETLAAWADGALPPSEATAVESHLADCPRCRAMSAAFARTIEPVAASAPAVAPPGIGALRWMLPLAATIMVAAAVGWRFWPRAEQLPPAQDATTAAATSAAPVQDMTAPPSQPPVKPELDRMPTAKARPEQSAPAPTPPAQTPAAATTTPQPVAPPPQLTVSESVRVEARPPLVSTSRMSVSASLDSGWKVIELTVPAADIRANAGAGRGGGLSRQTAVTAAPPVGPLPRWRVTGPSSVERSADGGATWAAIPVDATGLVITNGSAPTPFVCWIVGEAGMVLVSRNGGPFTRVPFPEAADLKAILALDDRRATVTAADGRAFITDDGGQTWRIARF